MTLEAANASAHALVDEAWLDVLERVMAADVMGARSALVAFETVLRAHMDFEDAEILPRFSALPPGEKRTLEHVEGDHKILLRVLDIAREKLAELDPATTTSRMLAAELSLFVRPFSVHEHHTTREQREVYPALDAALDEKTRDDLAARLLSTVEGAASASGTQAR